MKNWVCLYTFFLVFAAHAQHFTKVEYVSMQGDTLRYQWWTPLDNDLKKKPLVIWLHGKGERGYDNQRQVGKFVRALADTTQAAGMGAYIWIPQCPPTSYWSSYDKTVPIHKTSAEVPRIQELMMDVLHILKMTKPIDPQRIYVVGISMGGFGAWDFAARYPNQLAGMIAICGGGDPSKVGKMRNLPVWAFHGNADQVVPYRFTQTVMAELLEAQPVGYSKFSTLNGVGHNAWEYAFSEPGIWRWLFSHTLKSK